MKPLLSRQVKFRNRLLGVQKYQNSEIVAQRTSFCYAEAPLSC